MEKNGADAVVSRSELIFMALVERFASTAKARVCRTVVSHLRGLPRMLEDSVLRNAWDEVCVQVQGEQSVCWDDAYIPTVEQLVATRVDRLTGIEKQAIWLQSDYGSEWLRQLGRDEDRGEDGNDPIPATNSEVIAVIVDSVLGHAANYENSRIRTFLESAASDELW